MAFIFVTAKTGSFSIVGPDQLRVRKPLRGGDQRAPAPVQGKPDDQSGGRRHQKSNDL